MSCPLSLSPDQSELVRADLATCAWGGRGARYALWAKTLGVSISTIKRTVLLWAGRVPDRNVKRRTSISSNEGVSVVA